jgi:outer membrane protein assembly factor BamB
MRRRFCGFSGCGFVLLAVLLATLSTRAMVYSSLPKPSVPMVIGDRLVFADADRKKIICIDRRDGKVQWETEIAGGNAVVTVREGRIFVGAKRAVYEIDGAAKLRTLFGTKFERSQVIRVNVNGVLLSSELSDF